MFSLPWRPDQPKTPFPITSTPQVGLTTHWLIYLFDLFFFSWILDCLFICYFWSLLLRRGLKWGLLAANGGSSLAVAVVPSAALSCCEAWALEHAGLSCDAPALLPRSAGIFPGPGGRTCVPCIGKWTLRSLDHRGSPICLLLEELLLRRVTEGPGRARHAAGSRRQDSSSRD